MPRVKRNVEEEAAPKRRGRPRKAEAAEAVAEEKAAPKRRSRPRKAAAAEAVPEKANGNGASRGRAKDELLFVEQYVPVWDALSEGKDTPVTLAGDVRGKTQEAVAEFLDSRGRKKTTAQMVIDHLVDQELKNASGVVSHMINKGLLAVD